MARPLRVAYPNAVYHLTSRGNGQAAIYHGVQDREKFLEILSIVIDRYDWICYAYCLMDNHYHLLVETPTPNLSLGMRHLNGVYTQWFNRTHQRVGHVFQGRFKAILVQKGSHLFELARYIVLNPVRAKIVKRPAEYRWSSFPATLGLTDVPKFIRKGSLLENFGSNTTTARRAYERFVNEGVEKRPWEKLRGEIYFGDEDFVKSFSAVKGSSEVPRVQRTPVRPPLKEILAKQNGVLEAYRLFGYHLAEIAQVLGVHYTTVSRHLKKLETNVR